jgi:hypothetical protein
VSSRLVAPGDGVRNGSEGFDKGVRGVAGVGVPGTLLGGLSVYRAFGGDRDNREKGSMGTSGPVAEAFEKAWGCRVEPARRKRGSRDKLEEDGRCCERSGDGGGTRRKGERSLMSDLVL